MYGPRPAQARNILYQYKIQQYRTTKNTTKGFPCIPLGK